MDNNNSNLPTVFKLDEKEYNKMMDKFNKLNENYNSNLQNITFYSSPTDFKYEILDSDEKDLIYFIDKVNSELSINRKNIDEISNKLKNYEIFLENINIFKNSIEITKKNYDNLLSKSYGLEIKDRTFFKGNFYNTEKELSIEALKEEINSKIQDLKEEYAKNINQIMRFKKLLIKASPEENKINICNICATNKINICINPCGHVFCKSCTDKMNNCGMCRGAIATKIKVYLDDVDEDYNSDNTNIEPFSGFNNNGIITNVVNV